MTSRIRSVHAGPHIYHIYISVLLSISSYLVPNFYSPWEINFLTKLFQFVDFFSLASVRVIGLKMLNGQGFANQNSLVNWVLEVLGFGIPWLLVNRCGILVLCMNRFESNGSIESILKTCLCKIGVLLKICSICDLEPEITEHLFFLCHFSSSCIQRVVTWNLCPNQIFKDHEPSEMEDIQAEEATDLLYHCIYDLESS